MAPSTSFSANREALLGNNDRDVDIVPPTPGRLMSSESLNNSPVVTYNVLKVRSKPRGVLNYVLVYSTVIVDFMGYTLLAPLAYYFIEYFHVDMGVGSANSLLMSSYGLGLFVSSLVLGSMSDFYGRSRVIFWALCGTAMAYCGQALAWSFSVLVMFRLVGGLFSGTRPVLLAYLADTVSPADMPFYSSLIGLCVAVSQCLASGAGGALAMISLQAPLYVSASVTAITAISVWLWLQEPIPDMPQSPSIRHASRTYDVTPMNARPSRVQRNMDAYMKHFEWTSVFACLTFMGAAIQFNFSSWITLLPLLCGGTWHLSAETSGYILASQGLVTIAANILLFIPLTKYCLNVTTVACLGGLCHSLVLGVAFLQTDMPAAVGLGYCITVGNTLCLAAVPVISKTVAPMHRRGFVNAVVMSTQNLSMVLGPVLSGIMFDLDPSHKLPFVVLGVVGLLGFVAGLYVRSRVYRVERTLKGIMSGEVHVESNVLLLP